MLTHHTTNVQGAKLVQRRRYEETFLTSVYDQVSVPTPWHI